MKPENRLEHLLYTYETAPQDRLVEQAKEILGSSRLTLVRTVADLLLATGQILPHELAAVGIVLTSRAGVAGEDAQQRADQVERVVRAREKSLGEAVHVRTLTASLAPAPGCQGQPGYHPDKEPAFEHPAATPAVPEETEDEPARKHAAPLGG